VTNTAEQPDVRPQEVTELGNAIIKKVNLYAKRAEKKGGPLNMSEIAAAFIMAAHHVDNQSGGFVRLAMFEMLFHNFSAETGATQQEEAPEAPEQEGETP